MTIIFKVIKTQKKLILSQMFDVRPVNEAGDLDMEKVMKITRIAEIPALAVHRNRSKYLPERKNKKVIEGLKASDIFEKESRRFQEMLQAEKLAGNRKKRRIPVGNEEAENIKNIFIEFHGKENGEGGDSPAEYVRAEQKDFPGVEKREKLFLEEKVSPWSWKRLMTFASFSAAVLVVFFLSNFVIRGLQVKNSGIQKGSMALADLAAAEDNLRHGDFQKSYIQFNNAHEKLNQVSEQLRGMGVILVNATKYVPYISKISSANHLVLAGDDISQAGILVSDMLETLEKSGLSLKKDNVSEEKNVSYLKLFQDNESSLKQIAELLKDAQDNLDNVNIDDVDESHKDKLTEVKKILPKINKSLVEFLGEEKIFVDILGGNGPRKYLFLFQNNQEKRATGGFIGSYALLDIFDGRVRKFFIDGIFNPDGQLRERVVPPAPIQKISANWSLHDSNWFPDFPVSAEKAAWFYEKTGGPTVDGVITMTPTVMHKLLKITGPIDMPEYGVTVDEDNFVEKIQYEVEIDYDKELNQPKKILSDLAPKILDKIFNLGNFSDTAKTLNIILESLNEKQILVYSKNWDIQKVLSENGWSGEILNTSKDYVSVINTNINGFKTDGVIDEKISHKAEIQSDGTVIDTLTITRTHNGGDTPYDWWNKVNADYMRVYVPKGAKLLSAEGQTREFNEAPLDYGALGYKRDPQVQMEEDSLQIDEESGTRIYEDGGKTVFANWVYVSPKETVTVKYVYVLPFKVYMDSRHSADNYSLLAQKQSGSIGSKFISEIYYPDSFETLWEHPEKSFSRADSLPSGVKGVRMDSVLNTDKFFALAFTSR